MTKKETVKIMTLICAAYSRFYKDFKDGNLDITIDFWAEIFEKDDYETVLKAVKQYIKTGVHPPTIADINLIVEESRNMPRFIKTGVDDVGLPVGYWENRGR